MTDEKQTSPKPIIVLDGGIAVRPYYEGDIPTSARHANNWKIKKNQRLTFPYPYTEEAARSFIFGRVLNPENAIGSGQWTEEHGAEGPKLPWSYAVTLNDECIGSIGLAVGKDQYKRSAELGYWLSEDYWSKGIMSKVAKAFVAWAWETFPVFLRLNSEADGSNIGSQKVLERAGFKVEARRENFIWKYGEVQSSVVYGILRPS